MRRNKKILYGLFFLFYSHNVLIKGENNFFSNLYQFNFEVADSILKTQKNKCLKSYYINSIHYNWWLLVTTNHEFYITQCLGNCSFAENIIQNNDTTFIYLTQAYRLRILLYNKQIIKAYIHTKQYMQLLKTYPLSNQESENMLLLGLLHYFGNKAHQKYPLLFSSKLFGDFSDKKGIEYLKKCIKTNSVELTTEACYFLTKIFYEIDKKPAEAIEYSNILTKTFPNNVIFAFYHINILLNLNKKTEAMQYKENALKSIYNNKQLTLKQQKHLISLIENLQ